MPALSTIVCASDSSASAAARSASQISDKLHKHEVKSQARCRRELHAYET
ncbi:hypothetical protein Hanom_Chr11g01035881 [Helianthus anomalus]